MEWPPGISLRRVSESGSVLLALHGELSPLGVDPRRRPLPVHPETKSVILGARASEDGPDTTMEKIRNAVIIHGPGRSGTTLLSRILSMHSAFAWISGYVDRFPGRPVLAVLNRLMAIDVLERWTRSKRYWPRPAEAYQFWNHYFPRFSDSETRSQLPCHDRPEECKRAIRDVLRYHGRPRFITKITGAPRANELEVVFDNPHVIYLHRDPRAVVASYYKQRWGYKRAPERFALKTEVELLTEYVQRYESSFEGRNSLKAFLFDDVSYERLIEAPDPFFRELLPRLRLSHDRNFFKRLRSWQFDAQANQAWRNQLTREGVAFLDDALKEYVGFTARLQRAD